MLVAVVVGVTHREELLLVLAVAVVEGLAAMLSVEPVLLELQTPVVVVVVVVVLLAPAWLAALAS